AHYVRFIYFKVNGNLAFDDVKVTMTNYSPIATAATTLNFMCEGDSICFFDVSTISGCDSIASRIWNFGDLSPLDTNKNPCHIYPQTGNYLVWLRVTASNGNIDSTSLAITISPVPSAQFSSNNVNGTIVNFTDLSTVSSGSIVNRYWNFGDLNFSSQQNPTHFYSSIGMYYVCLTVTSNNSCVNTVCDSVNVIGVGIEDYELPFNISVGPNPAKNQLTVRSTLHAISEIEILDVIGQRANFILLHASDSKLQTTIDISHLHPGIYFLKMISKGEPVVFKFIVSN
ncbi:MAG: PKD domain-containing protein, partial [Bacteroidia bacterium]|nr:PKD domain-containing protein [Bacteroidia bacterium]